MCLFLKGGEYMKLLSRTYSLIVFFILVTFIIMVAALAVGMGPVGKAQATVDVCFCHNIANNPITVCTDNAGLIFGHMGHVGNGSDSLGRCAVPTATPTVSPTATPTATPTPTEEPSPTPTPTPGEEVTPTPTEEPRVTPTETPQPHDEPDFAPSSTLAHPNQCNGDAPAAPIATGGTRVDEDTIIVRWWQSTDSVNHYVLEYGPTKDQLLYGVPFIPSTSDSFEINGVTSSHWYYRIRAEGSNYCQSISEIVDP